MIKYILAIIVLFTVVTQLNAQSTNDTTVVILQKEDVYLNELKLVVKVIPTQTIFHGGVTKRKRILWFFKSKQIDTLVYTPPQFIESKILSIEKTWLDPSMSKNYFFKFLYDNINYPDSSLKSYIQGRMIVRFKIDSSGINNIEIVRGIDKDIDESVESVFSTLSTFYLPEKSIWGYSVDNYFLISIRFVIIEEKELPLKD